MATTPNHFNLEAEQALLGSLILDSAQIATAAKSIHAEDFYHQAHVSIYTALQNLQHHQSAVDLITLETELKAMGIDETVIHPNYLLNLLDAPSSSANTAHYAALVKEKSTLRYAMGRYAELGELLRRGDVETIAAQNGYFHFSELFHTHKLAAVCMADVVEEVVEFLWKPWIPRAKLTLISGDPGIFKSGIMIHLAALLTTGRPMPMLTFTRAPMTALGLFAEDGLGDTVKPRFLAAGGDPTRFFAMTPKLFGEFTLPKMREILGDIKPALCWLDPMKNFVPEEVERRGSTSVRQHFLEPMTELAAEFDCAIVNLAHLNKGGGQGNNSNTIYRASGYVDYAATARSHIMFQRHPQDQDKYLMVSSKVNLGKRPQTLVYHIEENEKEVPMIVFDGITDDYNSTNVLAAPDTPAEKNAIDEARDFLQQELADAPKTATQMLTLARKNGISEATLKRARSGFVRAVKKSTGWMWELLHPAVKPALIAPQVDQWLSESGEPDPFTEEEKDTPYEEIGGIQR